MNEICLNFAWEGPLSDITFEFSGIPAGVLLMPFASERMRGSP